MSRWVLEMREYKYQISYIKGTKNVVADTLSRPVLLIEAHNEGTWLGKSREEMRNLQREEERWKVLIDYIEGGRESVGLLALFQRKEGSIV